MSGGPQDRRRGVTRGYVGGLIAAFALIAVALVIAGWGGVSYFTGVRPVSTEGIWMLAAELIVGFALIVLVWGLWRQALVLLRGQRTPPWAHTLVIGMGGYFVWCLGGILFGMGINETWFSPFAIVIAITWAVCSVLFWAVLARRVYTDRPTPRWPWEGREGGEEDPNGSGPQAPDGDR